MSETNSWDHYLVRVRRYLDTHDLKSEELDYKQKTGQQLRQQRGRLISERGPFSIGAISNLDNLAGWRAIGRILRWLGTDVGTDALRELWAPYGESGVPDGVPPVGDVIARVRAFSQRLPKVLDGDRFSGSGVRMRPISVLLMALDFDQYPPFKRTEFDETYKSIGYPVPSNDADEASLYEHAIGFLDRFIEEATKRGFDVPGTRLEAQSLVWALGQHRDTRTSEGIAGDPNDAELSAPDPALSVRDLAGRLLLPSGFLANVEALLDDKRQVIFRGRRGPVRPL